MTVRSRRRYSSYKGQVGKIADNLLKREFEAAAPTLKWVTDVTEFKIADRKVHLSPVMDLVDRLIVSYSVSQSPTVALTNQSLSAAIWTLASGEAPMMHSTRDSSTNTPAGRNTSATPAWPNPCRARAIAWTTR